MPNRRYSSRLSVIRSYLTVAFIYLSVFLPISLTHSDSILLQSVHLIDAVVCLWATWHLYSTKSLELPSMALCAIAYITVVAVMVTGGFFSSGPFLVFPYVPFVTFLSWNKRSGFIWLMAMFITMGLILLLGVQGLIELPLPTQTFMLYWFMYLLTIMLLSSYVREKEHADFEINRQAEELSRKNIKLRRLNDLKDEFILLASHQLRTPATGVKQYLGMLLQGFGGNLTRRQREYIKVGYDSNERQIRIVNDLLLVAQADGGKVRLHKESADVSKLVKGVLKEKRSIFRSKAQTVTQHYPNKPSLLKVDGERLCMALDNIIDNASKYTPKGKNITVEVESHRSYLSILVSDEGVGISQQDRHRLFKKFSRIDNPLSHEVGGSGLGLYWAKKIIDFHHGKLLVRSRIGKGTTFEIRLPKS